ncbi:UNVERIFIED_CONTAM: Klhl10 [Trichonephila clavipes]
MSDFKKQQLITFKELLDSHELVNVTLQTEDGGQQKVHLEILAAVSPYFRRLINSSKNGSSDTITVPETSKDTLVEIINYIYTGKVCLREEKVKALIDSAEILAIPGIIKLCKKFLTANITVPNCINRYNFANSYQYLDLREKAMKFILTNFEEVYKSNAEYSELQIDDLVTILSSDFLNVKDEETVYWAMIKWLDADVSMDNQSPFFNRFFEDHIWTNELISKNEDCQGILFQASQLFADLQNGDSPQVVYDLHHPFLRPRVPNEIIFVMGGWSAGSATNIMETYDCKTQRWFLSLNSDSIPRCGFFISLWIFTKMISIFRKNI